MPKAKNRRRKKKAKPTAKTARQAGEIKPAMDPIKPSELPSEAKSKVLNQAVELAMQYQVAGQPDEAEGLYLKVLKADPAHSIALNMLAVVTHQKGFSDRAIELIDRALTVNPDDVEAHINLGLIYKSQGRLAKAASSFRHALAVNPDHPGGHFNLGRTLQELAKPEEAEGFYRQALALKPDYPEAHGSLGNIRLELGRPEQALESYRRVLELSADNADAYINMGNALKILGKSDQAEACYVKAISLNPDIAHAHNNLGVLLKDRGELDAAADCYRRCLALDGTLADAYFNFANTLHEQGDVDGAARQMDLALLNDPDRAGWHIRKILLTPAIPASPDDIQFRRRALEQAIVDLRAKTLSVVDPAKQICATNFYLSYHHLDNRKLVEAIAQLHMAACTDLAFNGVAPGPERPHRKKRIRLGVLSTYLRQHTIGKLLQGIIKHLSRDEFEVILFRLPGTQDDMAQAIDQTADKVVALHSIRAQDHKIIAAEALDILFYPDIGMSYYTYFMAFARLAPVQMVTWGHPDTTGIPNIDYFVSSALLEPDGSASHYTEKLLLLSQLPTYYYRPEPPQGTYRRRDYSLPEKASLYVCPQNLFKLHPMFDLIIGELLRRDPDGVLVLIDDGRGGHWNRLLMDRLKTSAPDADDRVIFVERMPTDKFLGLLLLADALLDVPTFSGGNSSLEAFALGAPIVTWPGNFMRARVTAGCYWQMGLNDLIASDAESYVSLALKLAHSADFKKTMQEKINQNSHKLFERIEVVRELERFFKQSVQDANLTGKWGGAEV